MRTKNDSSGHVNLGSRRLACSLAAAALLTGAICLLFFAPRDRSPAPSPRIREPLARPASSGESVAPVAAAAIETAAAPAPGRFRTGDEYRRRFEALRTVKVDFEPLASMGEAAPTAPGAAAVGIEVRTSGRLTSRVLGRTQLGQSQRGWVLSHRLEAVEFEVRSDGERFQKDSGLARSLRTGEVFALVEESGRIAALRFPEAMEPAARDQWRVLLARLQVVIPEGAEQAEWESAEDDGTGTYLAVYTRDGDGLRKTKQRYLRAPTAEGADLAAAIEVEGAADIALDGLIEKLVEGEERLTAGTVLAGESYLYELESHVAGASPVTAMDLDSVAWESVTAAPEAQGSTDLPAFETLLSHSLELAAGGEESYGELAQVGLWLDRWFAAEPDNLARAIDFLRGHGDDLELGSFLIGAVASQRGEAAALALESVFADTTWPEGQRLMAVMALIQIERPGERLEASLARLVDEGGTVGNSALLALGSIGNRVAAGEPERAAAIEKAIRSSAEGGGEHETLRALVALGNLGPSMTPDLVERGIAAEDAATRSMAVRALRRVFDERAGELLLQTLKSDPAEEVRRDALLVLTAEDRPGRVDALVSALTGDASENLRIQALQGLEPQVREDATLGDLVAEIAHKDVSEAVRLAAEEVLAGL